MGKKKDEKGPVRAFCNESFVLGPEDEDAQAGEILELDPKKFAYFERLGRVREATDEDLAEAEKAASKSAKKKGGE